MLIGEVIWIVLLYMLIGKEVQKVKNFSEDTVYFEHNLFKDTKKEQLEKQNPRNRYLDHHLFLFLEK